LQIELIENENRKKEYDKKKEIVKRQKVSNHEAERKLFHGTFLDDVEKICSDGYDRNLAGKHDKILLK